MSLFATFPVLLAACLVSGAMRADASSPDDASIFATIETLRPVADAITIDGNCSDWGAVPIIADPGGDAGGDLTRDISGVAIAPRDDSLLVRIDTVGAPAANAQNFWLELDYRKQQYFDLKFSLDSSFQFFDYFPETGEGASARAAWTSGQIAVGSNCVEARIPYAALDALLPAVMQSQLSGASARPWLRVRATTGEPLDFFDTEIDHGSAVGSFRLVATPYTLDPPAPPGAETPFETEFPLREDWYLGQGSHGVGSHQFIPWAYDWHRVDNALLPESPQRSPNNSDNFSFGEPIYATGAGTVYSLLDGEPDCPPYANCGGGQVNFLFVEVAGQIGILYSHTKLNSISLAQSDSVVSGMLLAQVGNSGSYFSWSHLHHEVRDISSFPHVAIALALTDVRVGLNPGPNDPWRRSFPSWVPRDGFFVSRATTSVPSLPPAGLAALALALIFAATIVAWRSKHTNT